MKPWKTSWAIQLGLISFGIIALGLREYHMGVTLLTGASVIGAVRLMLMAPSR